MIRPLPIDLRRIEGDGEEDPEQRIVGDHARIVGHPDRLGVSRTPAGHGLVVRARSVSAGIARNGLGDAADVLEHPLHAPEASTGEHGALKPGGFVRRRRGGRQAPARFLGAGPFDRHGEAEAEQGQDTADESQARRDAIRGNGRGLSGRGHGGGPLRDGRRDRSGGLEAQRDAVHAVAKPRRGGSVGEDVAEMAAAAAAMHLRPAHPQAGSVVVPTASARGAVKLGQPVPLSNFALEAKSGWSHPAQTKRPARFSALSGLDPARSVPCSAQDRVAGGPELRPPSGLALRDGEGLGRGAVAGQGPSGGTKESQDAEGRDSGGEDLSAVHFGSPVRGLSSVFRLRDLSGYRRPRHYEASIACVLASRGRDVNPAVPLRRQPLRKLLRRTAK